MNSSGKTKNALLWMSLSNEPFVVLYAILPFLIRKDLNASLVQLSILATLRPVLSIFSFCMGWLRRGAIYYGIYRAQYLPEMKIALHSPG